MHARSLSASACRRSAQEQPVGGIVGFLDAVVAEANQKGAKLTLVRWRHLHSDELKSTNLMMVERHETLAAPDAYAANGGWPSGRSAKVITYSKRGGEVFRSTLRPEMVAANDNIKQEIAA